MFVAGYVAGLITLPMVALGAIRAIYELAESTEIKVIVGVIVFGFLVVLISVVSAFWAIFFSG
jgi:hypothetical protein